MSAITAEIRANTASQESTASAKSARSVVIGFRLRLRILHQPGTRKRGPLDDIGLSPRPKYLRGTATGNCERKAAIPDGRRYPHSGEARDAAVCSFARITMVEGCWFPIASWAKCPPTLWVRFNLLGRALNLFGHGRSKSG